MALEQNPFLPPTRPGGANGKQCLNGPTEQLNITSRCITRSLQLVGTGINGQRLDAVQAKHLPSREELYNVALCYDADPGTDGDAKGKHSPGDCCTSLGRLGGIEPARLTDAKPGTEGPRGTGVEGLAAAYRDRFPLKVSWYGAGLEQTGAEGRPIVREGERGCGRL